MSARRPSTVRPLLPMVFSACAALGLAAPRAHAEGKVTRATLSWVRLPGAESCIAAPALAEAIEERLGHPVFAPASSATLSVEGWVEPAPRPMKWRGVVTVASAEGEVLGTREILSAAPGCDDLVPRLALAIALMVDPEVVASHRSPPIPALTAAAMEERPPPAPLRPGSRAALQWTLGPVVGVGAMPGKDTEAVAPGALLRMVAGPPASWGVELQAAFFPPRPISTSRSGAAARTVYRAHGAVLGCPLRVASAVRFDLCGGFVGGGVGIGGVSTKGVFDAQITPRLGYRFSAAPVALVLGASLAIPLLKPTLVTSAITYFTSPVYGTADIGVGVELP